MKPLLTFLIILCSFLAGAQTEQTIRALYQNVNNKISESLEHGFEGSLYQNQLVVNKNGKSWPAVGYYADTLNFWYEDDPGHLSAADRDPKTVLLKVVKSSRIGADVRVIEEYLYNKGTLLFYYSYWGEEANLWETRVYYSGKGIAFKTSVKLNSKELTPKELATPEYRDQQADTKKILANGTNYQQLFLKSM